MKASNEKKVHMSKIEARLGLVPGVLLIAQM